MDEMWSYRRDTRLRICGPADVTEAEPELAEGYDGSVKDLAHWR